MMGLMSWRDRVRVGVYRWAGLVHLSDGLGGWQMTGRTVFLLEFYSIRTQFDMSLCNLHHLKTQALDDDDDDGDDGCMYSHDHIIPP
jgi:hypothetical protein